MQWSDIYDKGHEPSDGEIRAFVATPLWDRLADHLWQAYKVWPKLFHSLCSMDDGAWKGWNVKYRKCGKALCTLYPKQGHFIALVNVGTRESAEADLLMPLCDAYTRNLYNHAKAGTSGKALGIDVTSESILQDVKALVALRAAPPKV